MPTKKVLLVEDEPDIAEIVKKLLELHNYEVVEARNGAEAITLSKEVLPDIILMDIDMPVMNGFEAASVIKANRDTYHIPLLMLTVDDSAESVALSYNLEVDGYVLKNFMASVLIKKIEEVLEKRKD